MQQAREIFPGLPHVESPLFHQVIEELDLTPEECRVATDLHERGYAVIDFPDEEVPEDVAHRARPVLRRLIADLEAAQADAMRGERVREGYRIALIGAPHAGKSSWLNPLVRRDAAIVTATPGTTRDVIEAPLNIAGYKVLLADTAGLRDTTDEIEAVGVRRARAWAASADLRI